MNIMSLLDDSSANIKGETYEKHECGRKSSAGLPRRGEGVTSHETTIYNTLLCETFCWGFGDMTIKAKCSSSALFEGYATNVPLLISV